MVAAADDEERITAAIAALRPLVATGPAAPPPVFRGLVVLLALLGPDALRSAAHAVLEQLRVSDRARHNNTTDAASRRRELALYERRWRTA